MAYLNRFMAAVLSASLILYTSPLEGRTRKGDRLLLEGRAHEANRRPESGIEAGRSERGDHGEVTCVN
jgi:hypothetical protein